MFKKKRNTNKYAVLCLNYIPTASSIAYIIIIFSCVHIYWTGRIYICRNPMKRKIIKYITIKKWIENKWSYGDEKLGF